MSWGSDDDRDDGQPRGWGEPLDGRADRGAPPPPAGDAHPDRPGDGWGDAPRGGAPALRPLTLGDVLDGTFRITGRHWRAFAVALAVTVVPLALLNGIVFSQTVGAGPGLVETLRDPQAAQSLAAEPSAGQIATIVGAGAASAIAGFLLTPLTYGIAVVVAARGYRRDAVDAMDSVRAAARRWPALLGATVLSGLLPFLIFVLPLVLVGFGAATDNGTLAAVGGALLLVSLAAAVFVVVRLLLVVPAVVLEQLGPVQALRRSNALVKGRTLIVLGTIVVVYLIVAIVGLVLAVPFQGIAAALGRSVGAVATTAGQIISSIVTNALLGMALTLLYFDRRVRAEGHDLDELADELDDGSGTTTAW